MFTIVLIDHIIFEIKIDQINNKFNFTAVKNEIKFLLFSYIYNLLFLRIIFLYCRIMCLLKLEFTNVSPHTSI